MSLLLLINYGSGYKLNVVEKLAGVGTAGVGMVRVCCWGIMGLRIYFPQSLGLQFPRNCAEFVSSSFFFKKKSFL